MATGRRKTNQLLPFFSCEIDVIEFHLYYLHDSSSIGTVFGLLTTNEHEMKMLGRVEIPLTPFVKGGIGFLTRQSTIEKTLVPFQTYYDG